MKRPLTFHATAGEVLFRDHAGRIFALPLAMTMALHMALWRELATVKGAARDHLSTIREQLAIAREDAIKWRLAA